MANAAAQRADGQQGILIEGVNLAPDFSPNGIYSVDGVHPNPRGAAIIANRIIESLNADKGTQIPLS
jgi:lysophospholipase L1-like esterase